MAGPTIRLTFAGDSADLERTMGRVGDSADRMEKTFSAKSLALGAAGAAAGMGLMNAFTNSLDMESAQAKLKAQLGDGEFAAEMGSIAGNLYADAYGESLGEVNDAVRSVIQSGALMEDASNEQIQSITANAMSLADAFGVDVQGTMTAVGQMMKTGLAPDAATAMDIVAAGFQQGVDKSGDFLDTLNEYGTQFRKFGLDGQTATGLLSQGLKAGARDADLVADSIKEFSIRAIDGSKSTTEGFKAIGLSADDMAKKIAKGGPESAAALDLTLDRLRGMKNPTEQAAAATALFGTQAEDLGLALYALDPSAAAARLGDFGGAAQKVNDTLGDTAQNKIEAVKRGFDEWMVSIVGVEGPLGDVAAGVAGMGPDAFALAGNIGMAAMALRGLGIATGIATAAQWLFNFAMAANPIMLIVIAIAALVAGLIWAYNNVDWFREMVDGAWWSIKNAFWAGVTMAQEALAWLKFKAAEIWWKIETIFWNAVGAVSSAIEEIKKVPGKIGAWMEETRLTIERKWNEVLGFLGSLPGRVLSAIGDFGKLLLNAGRDLLTGLWSGITGAAGWLRSKVLNFFGSILPGWAKDILGIRSPSKVFADLGQYIPLGMAKGIEDNLGAVSIASARMAAAATDPFDGLGDVVEFGSVSEGTWDSLKQAGWKGRADDGMEALYRPAGSTSAGSSGGVQVRFVGNTSDALATVIMQLIRTGKIQITR